MSAMHGIIQWIRDKSKEKTDKKDEALDAATTLDLNSSSETRNSNRALPPLPSDTRRLQRHLNRDNQQNGSQKEPGVTLRQHIPTSPRQVGVENRRVSVPASKSIQRHQSVYDEIPAYAICDANGPRVLTPKARPSASKVAVQATRSIPQTVKDNVNRLQQQQLDVDPTYGYRFVHPGHCTKPLTQDSRTVNHISPPRNAPFNHQASAESLDRRLFCTRDVHQQPQSNATKHHQNHVQFGKHPVHHQQSVQHAPKQMLHRQSTVHNQPHTSGKTTSTWLHVADDESIKYLDIATCRLAARRHFDQLAVNQSRFAPAAARSQSNTVTSSFASKPEIRTSSAVKSCRNDSWRLSEMSSTSSGGTCAEYDLSSDQSRGSDHAATWTSDVTKSSSDSSNDTFSEYDIRSDDSVLQEEYDYYLQKIKDNIHIKQEVMRMIKTAEHTVQNRSKQDKNDAATKKQRSSLTSVSSLSELSAILDRSEHDGGALVESRPASDSVKDIRGGSQPPRCSAFRAFKQSSSTIGDNNNSIPEIKPQTGATVPDRLSVRVTNYKRPQRQQHTARNTVLNDMIRLNHDRQLLASW